MRQLQDWIRRLQDTSVTAEIDQDGKVRIAAVTVGTNCHELEWMKRSLFTCRGRDVLTPYTLVASDEAVAGE